jgi:hypothetical protein
MVVQTWSQPLLKKARSSKKLNPALISGARASAVSAAVAVHARTWLRFTSLESDRLGRED